MALLAEKPNHLGAKFQTPSQALLLHKHRTKFEAVADQEHHSIVEIDELVFFARAPKKLDQNLSLGDEGIPKYFKFMTLFCSLVQKCGKKCHFFRFFHRGRRGCGSFHRICCSLEREPGETVEILLPNVTPKRRIVHLRATSQTTINVLLIGGFPAQSNARRYF